MTDSVTVHRSPVHGRGAFARVDLAAGDHVGFYAGEVIDAEEADRRHDAAGRPDHTMLFARADGMVVDGSRGGNATRFLNHGCVPNCHAEEYEDGTIGFVASTALSAGEELFIDYQLQVEPGSEDRYPCRCGAESCRGTMVAQRPICE